MEKAKSKRGGYRPGAGRKPKPKADDTPVLIEGDVDMLELLQNVALGKTAANALQVRAAIAAVQYTHVKRGDGGKKDEQQRAAEEAASRFKRQSPPKLVAKNGQPV